MGICKKLAMYDVRGIQNYIYRTAKVSDAIGASAIVENIILDALKDAVEKEGVSAELDWCDDNGTYPYSDLGKEVQVLYIGGGNAFVAFEYDDSNDICLSINKHMSKYVLENTYSLQLAIAVVDRTDNYATDYKNIFDEMVKVKAKMEASKPLGVLPVMDIEIKSGLPVRPKSTRESDEYAGVSMETYLKKKKEDEVRDLVEKAKKFDSYIESKGVDSTIAVVHIDGNNMGIRIRELISGIQDYAEAVSKMRDISFNINNSYKKVFKEMETEFNNLSNKGNDYNVLKILTAGDDITYICKGKYALSSVELFCEKISTHTMNGETDKDSIDKYGFSVCAGIAFIGSHFPFSIGYDVAEQCCDQAKNEAKKKANQLKLNDGTYKTGNWLDFQVCKNIQTGNLDATREREYVTRTGENLLIRPYELPLLQLEERKGAENHYSNLKSNILFFQGKGTDIQRSHLKEIRNRYSVGKNSINEFVAFLKSRDFKMPDGTMEMYTSDNRALWYDALEMMDCFEELKRGE